MVYSQSAAARRRCTATKTDGTLCRAWAVWDDPRQLCVSHVGRPLRGSVGTPGRRRSEKTNYQPCRCAAYKWPHRPGGGLCRWPDEPFFICITPAGTHSSPRFRLSKRDRMLLERFRS